MAKEKDIGTLLADLLKEGSKINIGEPFRKGVETLGQATAIGSKALGVLSTFVPGKEGEDERLKNELIRQLVTEQEKNLIQPKPGKEAQAKSFFPEFDIKQLDPVQQAQIKEVQKQAKDQVTEATQQGVPLENIQSQILQQAEQKQQVKQQQFQQQKQQDIDEGKLLADLLTNIEFRKGGPFDPGGQIIKENGKIIVTQPGILQQIAGERGPGLGAFADIQKLTGQQPLQIGEKDELNLLSMLDLRKELFKTQNPNALSPENAGKFNLLIDGANSTAAISNMLEDNITAQLFAQNIPNFLKSQKGKLLESAIERAIQAKTRIETGAALQPSELKSTAKRFSPRKGDTIQTALKRLKPLNRFFEGSLRVADPTGIHRQRASGGTTQTGLAQAIQAEKKRRGL